MWNILLCQWTGIVTEWEKYSHVYHITSFCIFLQSKKFYVTLSVCEILFMVREIVID